MINKKIKRILVLLISVFLLFNCNNKVFAKSIPYSNADGITTGWDQGDFKSANSSVAEDTKHKGDKNGFTYIRGIFQVSGNAIKSAFGVSPAGDRNYVVLICKGNAANNCDLQITLLDKTISKSGSTYYYADPASDPDYYDALIDVQGSMGGDSQNKYFFPVLEVKKNGKAKTKLYNISPCIRSKKEAKKFDKNLKDAKSTSEIKGQLKTKLKHPNKNDISKYYKDSWKPADPFLTQVTKGGKGKDIYEELKNAVKEAKAEEKKIQEELAKRNAKDIYDLEVDKNSIPGLNRNNKSKYTPNCSDVAILSFLWKFITVLAPFLLIIFGSIDFFKAVIASDVNKMNEEKKKFPRRFIALILLFLVPWLTRFLVTSFGTNGSQDYSYVKCIVQGKTS